MPQESLRSVVYRSFVTCDDPKGVAECKTIRKKQNQKKTTHSNHTSSSSEEHRKSTDQELQSFQIMEVSKGADKLTEVANSLSNRAITDHKSKNIARDLLQGALHLQHSLLMLSKLQQTSRPENETPWGGREGSEERRGSRDCYDELRDVIKESFARQNIRVKGSDFASSSSSCSSSSVRLERPKGPNLIARLMGLGEVPMEVANSVIFEQMEKEKEKEKEVVSKQRSCFLDIDLPRQKCKKIEVREGRTLEEVIEAMQTRRSDPPIVIMKPYSINEEKKHINILNKKDEHSSGRIRAKKPPAVDTRVKESSKKTKPLVPRVQKKETVVCKIEDRQKVGLNSTRKRVGTKDAKHRTTQDQVEKVCTLKKERESSNVLKRQVKFADRKETIKQTFLKSNVSNKNLGKARQKSKPSTALVDDNFLSNIRSKIEGSLKNGAASQNSEQTTKEVINPSCVSLYDDAGDTASRSSEPLDTAVEDESCTRWHRKDSRSATNTRHLLLSSVSFLNRVEDLFNMEACDPTPQCSDEADNDSLLIIECAKEILERKSRRASTTQKSEHIQEVVGEISEGIEYLRKYKDGGVVDSIHGMVERDLWWSEEVTGGWDLGWKNTREEVKEVVQDIEKIVVSEFVGEVVIELMSGVVAW